MSDTVVQVPKPVGAKEISLVGQIIAAAWIGVYSSLKFFADLPGADIWDIIVSGFAMAACFTPVYVGIILDKIVKLKELTLRSTP